MDTATWNTRSGTTNRAGGTMSDFGHVIREWETFYLLTGTAGAALAGLTFVALARGEAIARSQDVALLRAYSDPTLVAFMTNLALAAIALMPSLTGPVFSGVLTAAGAAGGWYTLAVMRQFRQERQLSGWDVADWWWFALVPGVVSAALVLVSILLYVGRISVALTVLGAALTVLLAMGVRNAWDLVGAAVAVSHGVLRRSGEVREDPEPPGEDPPPT